MYAWFYCYYFLFIWDNASNHTCCQMSVRGSIKILSITGRWSNPDSIILPLFFGIMRCVNGVTMQVNCSWVVRNVKADFRELKLFHIIIWKSASIQSAILYSRVLHISLIVESNCAFYFVFAIKSLLLIIQNKIYIRRMRVRQEKEIKVKRYHRHIYFTTKYHD